MTTTVLNFCRHFTDNMCAWLGLSRDTPPPSLLRYRTSCVSSRDNLMLYYHYTTNVYRRRVIRNYIRSVINNRIPQETCHNYTLYCDSSVGNNWPPVLMSIIIEIDQLQMTRMVLRTCSFITICYSSILFIIINGTHISINL